MTDRNVWRIAAIALGVAAWLSPSLGAERPEPATFCNPLDLDYPFVKSGSPRRGGSEPVVVLFEDDYYLFASAAQGYWHSTDLHEWVHISTEGALPAAGDAPGVTAYDGALYWVASSSDAAKVYRSADPKSAKWEEFGTVPSGWDPTFFVDTDGSLYLYRRMCGGHAIFGILLKPQDEVLWYGRPFLCPIEYEEANGWEGFARGRVTSGERPWLAPSSMLHHRGTYYLQYSSPGCDYPEWADGCYRARSPRGPFVYDLHSPICRKLTGFVSGVGSGECFRDRHGNLWRVTSMVVSGGVKRVRRICLFPAEFDRDGVLRCHTELGDYPMLLPQARRKPGDPIRTPWTLLSYMKPTKASSFADLHFPFAAVDEKADTFWSIASGMASEEAWLTMDLLDEPEVHAVQLNFAEDQIAGSGTKLSIGYCYTLSHSLDGKAWEVLIDRRKNDRDRPHEYVVLREPVHTRHLRLEIHSMARGGSPAVRELRVFGVSPKPRPRPVESFRVERDINDERKVTIAWKKAPGALGYLIRYGIERNKLYQHVQVMDDNSVQIHALNRGVDYYFRIDALNEAGLTEGTVIVPARFRRMEEERDLFVYE